ncbi:hypothetical protein RchiOBHm_Chr6g0248781 [Rosa chinensis]|uniref:Uncharacterized protein n=1 Tax=Rosa chinensis TaxID=74649 RepID=A0A2P6PK55_ROSCH|nr:hypothetical protein RchiOBHm_Chr6g0248781 [Rosa chinensis]
MQNVGSNQGPIHLYIYRIDIKLIINYFMMICVMSIFDLTSSNS